MQKNKEDYLKENIANAGEIRNKIHEETDYETKEILARAKSAAANILNDARRQAEKNKAGSLLELEKRINTIKERIFSALNLEKKRVIMGEKSKFINEVFVELSKQAKAFRAQQEYASFLKKIILDAPSVLGTYNFEVIYSPLDGKIINDDFIKEVKKSCQDKLHEEIILKFTKGDFNDVGFVAQSIDARLIYDARFTSLLNLAQDDIYMDLLRKL